MTPRDRVFHRQNETFLHQLLWSDSDTIPPGWKDKVKAHLGRYHEPVATDVWSEPNEKGCITRLHGRPIDTVLAEVNARIKADEVEFDESDFHSMLHYEKVTEWPPAWRTLVYPVTGGSEGHYVHIAGLLDIASAGARPYVTIALCKTFRGWEHAVKIAEAAGRHLGV